MKGRVDNDGCLLFYNDKKGKYCDYISNKLKKIKNSDEIDSLKIAAVSGKYIVDMISGICPKCDVQYSVPTNCVIWRCPVCDGIFYFENLLNGINIAITKKSINGGKPILKSINGGKSALQEERPQL